MTTPFTVKMPSLHIPSSGGSSGGGLSFPTANLMPKPPSQAQMAKAIVAKLQAANQGHPHSNILGSILGNLGSDVVDTVMGIPGGIAALATHPIGVGKAIVHSYEDTYGNGWDHFVKTFEAHPLGPVLDALTVVTGGVGAVAKGARLAALAGKTGEALDAARAGKLAKLSEPGFNVVRSPKAIQKGWTEAKALKKNQGLKVPTSANPVIRFRQNLTHRLTQGISSGFRGTRVEKFTNIEGARYAKGVAKEVLSRRFRNLYSGDNVYAAHLKAAGKVRNPQAAAVLEHIAQHGLHTSGVLPTERLDRAHALAAGIGEQVPEDFAKVHGEAANKLYQEVLAAHHTGQYHPILAAHASAHALNEQGRRIAGVSKEVADTNRFRPLMVHHGAQLLPHGDFGYFLDHQGTEHVARIVDHTAPDEMKIQVYLPGGKTKMRTVKNDAIDNFRTISPQEAHVAIEDVGHGANPKVPREWQHETLTRQQLQEQIKAEGGLEPIYTPMRAPVKGSKYTGRGIGQPAAAYHHNEMVNYQAGRIAHNLDVFGPEHVRKVAWAHAVDIHRTLRHAAVRVPASEVSHLEKQGYVRLTSEAGAPGFLAKTEREFNHIVGKGNEEGLGKWWRERFTESGPAAKSGEYLMVPKQMVDHLVPGVVGAGKFANALIRQPLQLWKTAILGWSPRFAVNNIVGNTILAALLHGGPVRAMRGIANLALRKGGGHALADMLGLKGISPMSEHTFLTHFGEHNNMTMADAEVPKGTTRMDKIKRGPMHALVGGHENLWRRKLASTIAREHPLVKRELSKLSSARKRGHYHGDPNTDLDVAIRKAIKKDKSVRSQISNKIDDALGDYRDFSHNEQLIRQAVPFYSWYRHIMRTSGKLVGDRPGMTNALANLGEVGSKKTDAEFGKIPEYLRAFLPVGGKHGGRQMGFNTTSLNPLNAAVDVVRGGKEFLGGQTSAAGKDLGGIINPFAQALIEQTTGQSLLTGAPISRNKHGLLPNALQQVIEQLPQSKVISDVADIVHHPQQSILSKLTPTGRLSTKGQNKVMGKGLQADLLAMMGVPLKDINVTAAQTAQKKIDSQNSGFHQAASTSIPHVKKPPSLGGKNTFKVPKPPTIPRKNKQKNAQAAAQLAQILAQLSQ